jgi:RNA polymerase sigma-70 factor (ECF subfamily)
VVKSMPSMVQKESNETGLIERLRDRDRTAFRELVDQHSKRVLNLCYRMTGNKMDAEDVAQEVFIEVYRNISRFRGDSSLSTWILKIAHNRSLNFLRDHRKTRVVSIESVADGSARLLTETLAGSDADIPDRRLEIERNRVLLYDSIAELPEKLQKPFSLHKLDDMPYTEIADLLGLSLSAVEARIHRAKKKLQKILLTKIKGGSKPASSG